MNHIVPTRGMPVNTFQCPKTLSDKKFYINAENLI